MPKKEEYKASIKILGRTYNGKGKTISLALSSLKVPTTRSLGVLTITHNKNSKERVLSFIQTNTLLNTRGMARDVAIKNTSLMFEGV